MKHLILISTIFISLTILAQPKSEEYDFFLRYQLLYDNHTVSLHCAGLNLSENDSGLLYAIDPEIDNDNSDYLGLGVVENPDKNSANLSLFFLDSEDHEKLKGNRYGLFRLKLDIPESEYRSIFFELCRRDIYLLDVIEEKRFYTLEDILLDDNLINEKLLLAKMLEDIQFTATEMRKQMESPMITEGPFKDQDLFSMMEEATTENVYEFLSYLIARPRKYMGTDWKLSEVFATWVVSGAPMVVKE
jgi:hypothetical protein